MNKVEERGFFELTLPGKDFFAYFLEIEEEEGIRVTADPYSFLPFFLNLTSIFLTRALITLPMNG